MISLCSLLLTVKGNELAFYCQLIRIYKFQGQEETKTEFVTLNHSNTDVHVPTMLTVTMTNIVMLHCYICEGDVPAVVEKQDSSILWRVVEICWIDWLKTITAEGISQFLKTLLSMMRFIAWMNPKPVVELDSALCWHLIVQLYLVQGNCSWM